MIADTSTAAGSPDEVGDNLAKPSAGPNHTPAVLIGGGGSTVFAGLLVAHLPNWTGSTTSQPPAILSMFLMAVVGVCFMMSAVVWTGANFRHHLSLIEAREASIEAREDALRADVSSAIEAMECRVIESIGEVQATLRDMAKPGTRSRRRPVSEPKEDSHSPQVGLDAEVIELGRAISRKISGQVTRGASPTG